MLPYWWYLLLWQSGVWWSWTFKWVFKIEISTLFSSREKRKLLSRRSSKVIDPRVSKEPGVGNLLLYAPSHISESHCFPIWALYNPVEILAFCDALLMVLIIPTSTAVKARVSWHWSTSVSTQTFTFSFWSGITYSCCLSYLPYFMSFYLALLWTSQMGVLYSMWVSFSGVSFHSCGANLTGSTPNRLHLIFLLLC